MGYGVDRTDGVSYILSDIFGDRAMSVSVRLPRPVEKELARAASRKRVSKSQLIRDCLEAYLTANSDTPLAWELGKDLFVKVGSGRSDLSQNRKQILRDKLNARHRRD